MTDEEWKLDRVELALDGLLDEVQQALCDYEDDTRYCDSTGQGYNSGITRRFVHFCVDQLVLALGQERAASYLDREHEAHGERYCERCGRLPRTTAKPPTIPPPGWNKGLEAWTRERNRIVAKLDGWASMRPWPMN